MKKKWLMSLLVAGSLAFATGCAGTGDDSEDPAAGADASASAMEDALTPDLEGIPDVVAVVNGLEIPKDEFTSVYESQFQQLAMQAQMSGQTLDQEQLKTQTLDNLIGNKLLIQEADNRGIEATDEAIAAATDELVQSNQFADAEALFTALEEQGIPKDEATTQIHQQVRLDALLAEEGADAAPSEEELQAAYEAAKAQGAGAEGEEIPPFEEVRPQLEEQAKLQKKNEIALALVTELREAGDVVVNL